MLYLESCVFYVCIAVSIEKIVLIRREVPEGVLNCRVVLLYYGCHTVLLLYYYCTTTVVLRWEDGGGTCSEAIELRICARS